MHCLRSSGVPFQIPLREQRLGTEQIDLCCSAFTIFLRSIDENEPPSPSCCFDGTQDNSYPISKAADMYFDTDKTGSKGKREEDVGGPAK